MKRSDFISNRKIEIPKLDEKVIGPMVLQALLEADVNIDDTIENREILQKYIKKIVTAGMNFKEKEAEDQNGTTRRLMDVLRTGQNDQAGTSTGLFPMTSVHPLPMQNPFDNITYGTSSATSTTDIATGSSYGSATIGRTSPTSTGYATNAQMSQAAVRIGIDSAREGANSYIGALDQLVSDNHLTMADLRNAMGIGNAAI